MIDNVLATSDEEVIEEAMQIMYTFFKEPHQNFIQPPTRNVGMWSNWWLKLKDHSFMQLAFSDVDRLRFFFRYLPNQNPIIDEVMTYLHFIAYMGWKESVDFLMEN